MTSINCTSAITFVLFMTATIRKYLQTCSLNLCGERSCHSNYNPAINNSSRCVVCMMLGVRTQRPASSGSNRPASGGSHRPGRVPNWVMRQAVISCVGHYDSLPATTSLVKDDLWLLSIKPTV